MIISVSEAARRLEARGLLVRSRRSGGERVIAHVRTVLGIDLPQDLSDLYREGIEQVDDYFAMTPVWNEYVGWQSSDAQVTELLHVMAVPLFGDGFGNLYGLDLTPGADPRAVYFFDHERNYEEPGYAVGSSLGAFLLLLADQHRAHAESWPEKWQLKIDPDIDKCPRATAIWNVRWKI
jgi:hypothetical protein